MSVTVFHAKEPTFGFGKRAKFIPENYEKVAVVETDDLNKAHMLTNSIDFPWWENEEISWHKEARSFSVGDVILSNGKYFLCEMVGWEEFKLDELWDAEINEEPERI